MAFRRRDNGNQGRYERRMMFLSGVMIVLSLLLVGQVTGKFTGLLLAKEAQKSEKDGFYQFSDLFAEVYSEIKDKYVEPVDDRKIFEGAIQGMFLALDQHSQYLDPDNYTALEKETEGEFSGIGIHIVLDDKGDLTVAAPMPGSPAAAAGIQPWDRIVEIEGKSTAGIKLNEAVRKLTGPEGTAVNITVQRAKVAEKLYFTITRSHLKIQSVHSKLLDNGVLLARIERFSDNTTDDLREAIEDAKANGGRAIILDLRWNTGGLLKEAITVSNLFLDRGKLIVSTKGRLKDQNKEYRAESAALVDWPMLILVNSSSASASEIVAGAMRDHKRAQLIGPKGRRTYGKGSVQTIDPLEFSLEKDDNGNYKPNAIRITTAKYYTPNGISFDQKEPDKRGLAPDLEVEMTPEDEERSFRLGLLGNPSTLEPGAAASAPASRNSTRATPAPDSVPTSATASSKSVEKAMSEGEILEADLQLQFAIREMRKILREKAGPGIETLHASTESIPLETSMATVSK